MSTSISISDYCSHTPPICSFHAFLGSIRGQTRSSKNVPPRSSHEVSNEDVTMLSDTMLYAYMAQILQVLPVALLQALVETVGPQHFLFSNSATFEAIPIQTHCFTSKTRDCSHLVNMSSYVTLTWLPVKKDADGAAGIAKLEGMQEKLMAASSALHTYRGKGLDANEPEAVEVADGEFPPKPNVLPSNLKLNML